VPKRSRRAVHALLESVADRNRALHADKVVTPEPGNLNRVLNSVRRIAHHDHLVLVFSDFDGIDDNTHRQLSGIATHNDVLLFLVHDPSGWGVQSGGRVIVGDGAMQAEIDLGSATTREAVSRAAAARLDKIVAWQSQINLSVLPLSAGAETLPQIRKLMGRIAPQRRVR
jgi:hypothetical protein